MGLSHSINGSRGGTATWPTRPATEALPSRSSFPWFSVAERWLTEKARDDGARYGVPPDLWCVHGKLYDLSNYVDKHPGGAMWISSTRGSDITDAFETHHLNEAKVNAVLNKYFVRDAPDFYDDAPKRFTYADDGFYKTLKRRAFGVLGRDIHVDHGPTTTMSIICAIVFLTWAACFAVMCCGSSVWTRYAAAVGAAVGLHGLMGVGHNFFHQADSSMMYAWDFTMFSSQDWRVTHAMSHHMWPNLELDVEVSTVEPFLYFLTSKPRNGTVVYFSFHAFLLAAGVLEWIKLWVHILTFQTKLHLANFIVPLQLAALMWFHPASPSHAFGLFLTMHCLSSWLLASISFAVHRSDNAWSSGDPLPRKDFGLHIVATTNDHSVGHHERWWEPLRLLSAAFLFGWFNNHILHHMFPTVDHSRLQSLRPVLIQTMKEFGLEYKSFFFPSLWLATFQRHDMFTFLPSGPTLTFKLDPIQAVGDEDKKSN